MEQSQCAGNVRSAEENAIMGFLREINCRLSSQGLIKRDAQHSLLQERSPDVDAGLEHSAQLPHEQTYGGDDAGTTAFQANISDSLNRSPLSLRASTLPPTQGSHAATGDHVVVGWDVSNRLLDAYFSFIHPVWPIIYKPLYDCSHNESLSTLLPQPVLYAIYAIAACLKLDTTGSQMLSGCEAPSPSLFFEAALLSIQRNANSGTATRPNDFHPLNLLRPSVENCQALAILALQQHGSAESSNAFMLCSLASGMAIELDLHKAKAADEDSTSAQIASRLWWNLFVLDKMIACELGKPVLLRSEDSNANFPLVTESDEYQLLHFRLPNTNSLTTTKSYAISGFHSTVKLTKIMEKVARQIYSREGRETIRSNLQAAEQLRTELWQELNDYYALLITPRSDLQVDILGRKACPPSLVTNAVWTWTTMIMVHRPFYSYWQEQGWLPAQSIPTESLPLEVSFSAAEKVCQILEIHVENLQRFPCDLIFPIFTTASTLSHYRQVNRGRIDERTITRCLTMCIKWLSILGSNWKHAGKSKERLTKGLFACPIIHPEDNLRGLLSMANCYHEDFGIGERQGLEPNPVSSIARPIQGAVLASEQTQGAGNASPDPRSSNFSTLEVLPTSESILRNDDQSSNIDWAFLNMLGDADDELYAMNTDFRGLLDNNAFDLTFNQVAQD
ncbi:hypothetical protein LTS17_012002 [Exophiala oligosperma]